MRKLLELLIFIFELPIVSPVMLVYSLYVTKKIVEESDPTELMSLEDENELWSHIGPHLDSFYLKYQSLMYGVTTVFWILLYYFIKYLCS
jgi:hypothetical protein